MLISSFICCTVSCWHAYGSPIIMCFVHQVDEDNKASLGSLKSIMEEEEKRRRSRLLNMGRHSQFIGTFTRVKMV